eukprot:scaffold257941_cov35-Tisochrysis_lutea.AAC.1
MNATALVCVVRAAIGIRHQSGMRCGSACTCLAPGVRHRGDVPARGRFGAMGLSMAHRRPGWRERERSGARFIAPYPFKHSCRYNAIAGRPIAAEHETARIAVESTPSHSSIVLVSNARSTLLERHFTAR